MRVFPTLLSCSSKARNLRRGRSRHRARITLGLASLVTAILIMPVESSRAQMQSMSLEELSHSSTSIVLGKAQQKRSFWNEGRTQILTEITVRVNESLKGAAGSEMVITVPGGRVGNMAYEVSDMPVFVDDEEMLVFLWEHPTGRNLVNGGAQGKMEVLDDAATGRKLLRGMPLSQSEGLSKAGLTLAPGSSQPAAPLDDVLEQVRTYVEDK